MDFRSVNLLPNHIVCEVVENQDSHFGLGWVGGVAEVLRSRSSCIWRYTMACLGGFTKMVITCAKRLRFGYVRYDILIKGWIFGTIDESVISNFVKFESAREVWKNLESCYNPQINSTTDVYSPVFMYRTEFVRVPDISSIENSKRKIKLYEVTVEGCWWKAKRILKKDVYAAIEEISENGNTMLHIAVEMGHNYFLEKLLKFIPNEYYLETRNNYGRTALHVAAMVGNRYAAQLLVQKNAHLLEILDHKAQSPLGSAYINEKLNTYTYLLELAPRSFDLGRCPYAYHRNVVKLIVTAIFTKQYDSAAILLKKYPDFAMKNDQILRAIATSFPTELGFRESFICPSLNDVHHKIKKRASLLFHLDVLYKCVEDVSRVVQSCKHTRQSWLEKTFIIVLVPKATLYPLYELICLLILVLRFPFSVLYFLMWKVLAIIVRPITNIEKKKEYKKAKQILGLICDQMGTSRSCYSAPVLEAVRQDAYQVVDEILYWSSDAINSKNEEGHNVIQLAIINRSEKVFNLIRHIIERAEYYRTMKDFSRNNLAHLAGRLAPSFALGRTTGAALQLQRELQWSEEVKNLMSPLELTERNIYMETPEMMFNREHADLMKQGENWTKTTAESCSITAALIVTVVFAAAITVPGGSNQESGIPLFQKELAFAIFAVSNAFSLFTAATALLLFLSILTTRFSERDFLVSLPTRLILGLISLFLSTIAMIVGFGAILFLVFCDKRKWMLAPIVVFACLPILVIVTIKLPLLLDFFKCTYFPIFGNQSYIDGCKMIRKNSLYSVSGIQLGIASGVLCTCVAIQRLKWNKVHVWQPTSHSRCY